MAKNHINRLHGRLWITCDDRNLAGQGRIELLKLIGEHGSISAAAKSMGMSYKAAWDSVDAMNNLSEKPLVERSSGGKHGGGTSLTVAGEAFIKLYDKYTEMLEKTLLFMQEHPEVELMVDKLSFATSADNAFYGTITDIQRGAVSAIVSIDIGDNMFITSSITISSVDRLALAAGKGVCALINANQLILMNDNGDIDTSARNVFKGTITVIKKGAVNSEIDIDLGSNKTLRALITNESAEKMKLAYGSNVIALCKAPSVVIVA